MDELGRAFRDLSQVEVVATGRVVERDQPPRFSIEDGEGEEFLPGTDWLLQLWASDCSAHTVRAYAMSLLRYLRFYVGGGAQLGAGDRGGDPGLRVVGP